MVSSLQFLLQWSHCLLLCLCLLCISSKDIYHSICGSCPDNNRWSHLKILNHICREPFPKWVHIHRPQRSDVDTFLGWPPLNTLPVVGTFSFFFFPDLYIITAANSALCKHWSLSFQVVACVEMSYIVGIMAYIWLISTTGAAQSHSCFLICVECGLYYFQ